MKQDDFEIIWHKVKKITGWKKQNDLGKFLGIKSGSISSAKALGIFRETWAKKIAEEYNTTADYILYGEKEACASTTDNVNHLEDPIIKDLKLWLNELNGQDPDHTAWFRVELQNKFPEFKEWREKKRDNTSLQSSATG